MLELVKRRVAGAARGAARIARLNQTLDELRLAIGVSEARIVRAARYGSIREAEFKVFSQWGEDGIIQYLVSKIPIENEVFIEFGVESYAESNTRFLLQHDNWRGLILDAGTEHLEFVEQRGLRWRHTIDALSAFITRDNVDELFAGGGVSGDIGLLSIDLDGNDYWILDAISSVSPRILIVEYRSVFGPDEAVTIPYDPAFRLDTAHHSAQYYGASLAAICDLAGRKGYRFVGSNSAGVNAFFVRDDVAGDLPSLSPREGWVESRFRESRDESGRLIYVTGHRQILARMAAMPLVDVRTNSTRTVGETFGVTQS